MTLRELLTTSGVDVDALLDAEVDVGRDPETGVQVTTILVADGVGFEVDCEPRG